MRTKALMTSSSVFMALLGLIFTFMTDQVLRFSGIETGASVLLLVQACGALYVGFAVLNWMMKNSLIGGIYGRPVVFGNLLHFVMVTLVLIRSISGGQRSYLFVVGLCCYAVFAIWFGLALFIHPPKTQVTAT